MSERGPLVILMLVLALTVSALVLVLVEGERTPVAAAHSREFQQLVGGLGFGPATTLSECAAAFDPRLCPRCRGDLAPLPGGGVFCPEHACSLFDYPARGTP
jgi:hypothetical protein